MDALEEEIRKLVDRYATNEDMRRGLEFDLHLLVLRAVQDFRAMLSIEGTYTPEDRAYDEKRVA